MTTLRSEIVSLGLEGKVFLKGFVKDSELPDYYAACDIFVSFSPMEGFGLIFAEAMMAGKPILAFDVASIGEVVGDAGILATPSVDNSEMQQNMIRLLTNESLRQEVSLRSKQRSSLYSWDRSAELLLSALESSVPSGDPKTQTSGRDTV
jgi:glycosyltransferase involved in cell wall biosynthesis